MKKRNILVLMVIIVTASQTSVLAAGQQPSLTEQVRRQTMFNKLTDGIATLGKPKAEKMRILRQRKEARRIDRLKKNQARKRAQYTKEQRRKHQAMRRLSAQ